MGGLIAAQWGLNETADSLFGVIRATTSDGIPPGALVVAGYFGATLAVCDVTRMKVERVATNHSYQTIKFLKSKIGYAKGDSADHLASSDGGIRFLSLACALLCMSDSFSAASALHAMVLETAPTSLVNDPMMPTLKQLQQLLDALEHKLTRADFARDVSGWQFGQDQHWPLVNDGMHPSQELVKAMVQSFRAVHRLGTGGIVEIRAYTGIPWIISFTKWCLGAPPSVTTGDGTIMLEPGTGCMVHLYINPNRSVQEEVKVMQKIDRPDVLWSGYQTIESRPWSGMVSVEVYGRQQLSSRGLDSADARKALREALPFSLSEVIKKLWPEKNAEAGIQFHPALGYDNLRRNSPIFDLSRSRSHMFGDERNVITTLSKYLNIEEAEVTPLPIGGQSQRFVALEAFSQQQVKACACSRCFHPPEDYDEDSPFGLKPHTSGSPTNLVSLAASITGKGTQSYNLVSGCALMRLWAQIAAMTAEILALSLYNCTEALRVFWPGEAAALVRTHGKFARSVYECTFISRTPEFCLISDVLQFATSLIGHELATDLKSGTWIASASRGQVIYPLIFEFPALMARPLLLGGGPGQLFFQGSKFDRVISQNRNPTDAETVYRDVVPVADRVLNLYPDDNLEWYVNLAARDPELFFGTSRCQGTYNPHDVLLTIVRSLFVRCEHPEDAVLSSPAEDCVFATSLFFNNVQNIRSYDSEAGMYKYIYTRNLQDECGRKPFKIQVIPTAGNDGLRLFAMVSPFPGVVRDRACLQCCIDVCRKSGLEYIVL